jgi:hypothetical protein
VPVDGDVGDALVARVVRVGPPDQSLEQAVDRRAGSAQRSKRMGIDVGPFDPAAGASTTRTRITKPVGIDDERTQRSNSARSRCGIHARRERHIA